MGFEGLGFQGGHFDGEIPMSGSSQEGGNEKGEMGWQVEVGFEVGWERLASARS